MRPAITFHGIGASPGIAMGKAFVLPSWEWDVPDTMIGVTDLTAEFDRLYEGVRTSKIEIRSMKNEWSGIDGEPTSIFDAHLAILDDPLFMNEIQGIIQRQYKAAEVAVKEVIDKFVAMFDLLEDEYMRERALDIKDVGNRLLKHLLGKPDVVLPETSEPFILVAREISPSQLAHLSPAHVLGAVTIAGGPTSHTAIMARAMGIPLVSGLDAGMQGDPIQTGDELIVDGEEGVVFIRPDERVKNEYSTLQTRWRQRHEHLQTIAQVPAVTRDGVFMHLAANITSLKDVDQALANGAVGVGLFRTEFIYMERDRFPTEDEQLDIYRQVVEKLGGKQIVIRTLDIGADKQLDYFPFEEEENPCLGYRGIRISLDNSVLFKTQLRAILRASVYGNVRILFPMISSVREIREAKKLLEEAKGELRSEGRAFREDVPVGIMIEVPASVIIADALAAEVQFFSIGTNDLTQYTLAVDRQNDRIASLYDPFHPAVLQMIKWTAEAAKRHNVELAVCGELAGDVRALPIWLGLGVTGLSMSVQSILPLKERILLANGEEARERSSRIMACTTSEDIKALLDSPLRFTGKPQLE